MLQQVEQLVRAVGEPADAERHGPRGQTFRGPHPKRMRLLGAQRRQPSAGCRAQLGLLRGDERVGARDPRRQHPPLPPGQRGRDELERRRGESGRADVVRHACQVLARALEHQRHVGTGQSPQPQMHQHDDPECTERPSLEPCQVVARHVLHHPAAALDHAAVTGHEGDPEQVVPYGAEAAAQRSRRGGGHDGAQGAPRQPGRVDREPGAVIG